MTCERIVLTRSRYLAIVLGVVIAGLGLWVLTTQAAQAPQGGQPAQAEQGRGQGRGQRGPATPPAPCGPNIQGDLG